MRTDTVNAYRALAKAAELIGHVYCDPYHYPKVGDHDGRPQSTAFCRSKGGRCALDAALAICRLADPEAPC